VAAIDGSSAVLRCLVPRRRGSHSDDRCFREGRQEHVYPPHRNWIVDLDVRAIERSTPLNTQVDVVVERLEWMPLGATVPFVLNVQSYFTTMLDD
jgi:hypothetical protein